MTRLPSHSLESRAVASGGQPSRGATLHDSDRGAVGELGAVPARHRSKLIESPSIARLSRLALGQCPYFHSNASHPARYQRSRRTVGARYGANTEADFTPSGCREGSCGGKGGRDRSLEGGRNQGVETLPHPEGGRDLSLEGRIENPIAGIGFFGGRDRSS